jgi:hypothetical protein
MIMKTNEVYKNSKRKAVKEYLYSKLELLMCDTEVVNIRGE